MENPSLVTKKIFDGLSFELWNCELCTWDDNFDQEVKLKFSTQKMEMKKVMKMRLQMKKYSDYFYQ